MPSRTSRKKRQIKGGVLKKEKTHKQDKQVNVKKLEKVQEPENVTLWQTFYTHPVVVITTVLSIPYLIYIARLYLILKRPDLLNRSLVFGNWRQAVTVNDPRQVLIVGSMSSGTTQMSRAIDQAFDKKIEIGHENSDSAWYFVRDGTISWLHAIRFFPDTGVNNDKRRLATALGICGDGHTIKRSFKSIGNMGFHPSMYKEVCRSKLSHPQVSFKCSFAFPSLVKLLLSR